MRTIYQALLREQKKKMKNDNELCCVYQIRNTLDGKKYIGSTKDLNTRYAESADGYIKDLNRNGHHNKPLQRAWNKYGQDSFVLEILVHCYDDVDALENEQFFLDYYSLHDAWNRVYNIAKIAGRGPVTFGADHPINGPKREATLAKMRASNKITRSKPGWRESVSGENHPNFGKTKETSESLKQMGETQTAKWRDPGYREKHTGKNHPLTGQTKETNES